MAHEAAFGPIETPLSNGAFSYDLSATRVTETEDFQLPFVRDALARNLPLEGGAFRQGTNGRSYSRCSGSTGQS